MKIKRSYFSATPIEQSEWLSVRDTAKILGLKPRRVLNLINTPCPECKGEPGSMPECHRCRGTGKRLPAKQFGSQSNFPWMIPGWAVKLPDIQVRKIGKPKKVV